MHRLLALIVACSACSGLEALHGVCGDGVVDIGEDCDSGKDCRACSIDCAEDPCPDGYACGVDKLCHAPGGSFLSNRPSGVQSLPALGFGITDTDGDQYDDIVGLSKSSLITLYGDGGGTLDRQDTKIIPTIQGAPAVTHIDNDKTLDLIIPTFDGLVGYTSPFGVLSPFPFPIQLDLNQNTPKPITTITLDGHFLAILAQQAGTLFVISIDASINDTQAAVIGTKPVCPGIDPTTVTTDRVDRYDVTGASPTHVLAIESTTGKLCMVEMDHLVINNATLTATAIADMPMAPQPPPLLARLAASACPSLIITDPTGKLVEYPGIGTSGSCGLNAITRQLPKVQGQVAVGRAPLLPALIGFGADALAYPTGLYAIDTSTTPSAMELYRTIRGFSHVVSTDLDGDGDMDVIASSGVFGSQGASDDLELLYRYGTGAASDPVGFLSVNLDTLSAPTHLVTGDFDGDGVGDIVYVEALAGFERLMVAFGGHDGIHAPVVVSSSFHSVVTAAPLALANSSDPTGTKVDDLFVLDSPTNTGPAEVLLLTVLTGSPQRTLIPFFDPRPAVQIGQTSFGFSGAVSGHFTSAPNDSQTYQELVGIERFYSATSTSRLWLMQATKYGAVEPMPKVGVETLAITDCDPTSPPATLPMLCGNVAQYVPWRPNNDTPDIVFGIDQSDASNIIALDPHDLAAPAHASLASLVGPGLAAHSSYLADIDGDGELERLVNYAPKVPSDTPSGAVVRCRYDGAIECEKLDIPDLADWTCFDAVPARIVGHQRFEALPPQGAAQELAMLCRDASRAAVFRVWHDAKGFNARLVLPLDTTAVSELQIGDINGDGVDDVILFGAPANGAVPVVRVHLQCTSRQIADCPPLEFPSR